MKLLVEGKCWNNFSARAYSDKNSGTKVIDYSGYVPRFLGGSGDSIVLLIDVDTGRLIGWDAEAAREWIASAA